MTTTALAGESRVLCPSCGALATVRWFRTVAGRLVAGRATYGCECDDARYAVAAWGGEDSATERVAEGQTRLGL